MLRVILLESRTSHQPGKLQNVSKNDYGFTPSIFIVNENHATLSACLSIECTLPTSKCPESVQTVIELCEKAHLARLWRMVETKSAWLKRISQCGKSGEIRSGVGIHGKRQTRAGSRTSRKHRNLRAMSVPREPPARISGCRRCSTFGI
jgi:hypothetical protein